MPHNSSAFGVLLGLVGGLLFVGPLQAQGLSETVPFCDATVAGKCKPDGTTIVVGAGGAISAASGGGNMLTNASNATLPAARINLGAMPTVNVKTDCGAVGDNSTDNAAAFATCIASIPGGGTVYVPPGNYCVNTKVVVPVNVSINGTPGLASYAHPCPGFDNTVFELSGVRTQLNDMLISGAHIVGTTNPAIILSGVEAQIFHVKADGGSNVVKNSGGENYIFNSELLQAYGSAVVYIANGGGYLERVKIDQNWPAGAPTVNSLTLAPWAATTLYATKDIASTNGYILQATVGGTSGSIAPAVPLYNTNVVDGTVTWQLVGATTYYGVQVDTGGGADLFVSDTDLTGDYTSGVGLTNTLAGSAPNNVTLSGVTVSQNINSAVQAVAGNTLKITNGSNLGGCVLVGCKIVDISGAWQGDTEIDASTKLSNGATGVYLGAGGRHLISGDFKSVTTALDVAAGISDWSLTNCMAASGVTTGVNIAAGGSDRYAVTGCDFNGTTTDVADGGTGRNKIINNVGGLGTRFIPSVVLGGATSGTTTVQAAAVAGSTTITLPAGTTDFSGTGGTSQVVQQLTAGGALTVAQLAASDLSNGTTGSGAAVLANTPTLITPVLGAATGTSLTGATIYGGTAAGSSLNLKSTSNGSPSADTINLTAHNIVMGVSGGPTSVLVGQANITGATLLIAGSTSGAQTWKPAAVASGTITWPAGTTDFSGTTGIVQQASAGAAFTVSNALTGATSGINAAAGVIGEMIGAGGGAANNTVTITLASPGVISDTGACTPNVFNGCVSPGSVVNFTTTGALPTGMTVGTNYFVLSTGFTAGTSYRISATQGGAAINTSGSQSGVHTRVNNAIATGAGAQFTGAAVSLTAGDWDCGATSRFTTTGVTTLAQSWIGTTTNSATGLLFSTNYSAADSLTGTITVPNGRAQINVTGSPNYFLVGQLTFSSGTGAFTGAIQCRRQR